MVLKEFYSSLLILDEFLTKSNLPARLMAFANSVSSMKSELSEAEIKDKIEPSINTMQDMLLTFEADTGFPLDGSVFLEQIGLGAVLNISSWEAIRKKFKPGNSKAAVSELRDWANILQSRSAIVKRALSSLSSLGISDGKEFYHRAEDETLVTLDFADANMAQVQDVTNELNELRKNLELLARIDKRAAAKKFRVLAVSKASPMHMDLVMYLPIGMAINKIISGLLENAHKVQVIREEEQKIKSLKLANERERLILSQLKEASQEYSDPALAAKQQIVENLDEKAIDGSKTEVDKAVLQACKYFVKLLSKGSQVHVYLTAKNEQSKSANQAADVKKRLVNQRSMIATTLKNIQDVYRIDRGKQVVD